MDSKKQVIVVSLPGKTDYQYADDLKDIANFVKEMDTQTHGRDHLFVVHDKSGRALLGRHSFINAHFIEMPTQSLDMWMRDFPPCMPQRQVMFTYRPQYLKKSTAKKDEGKFDAFSTMVGLPTPQRCDLVLEGGNVVENGKDIAVVTERIFNDNPNLTEDELLEKLETAIDRHVVVIPDPEDATGHADGVVSFVEEDVLMVALIDDSDSQKFYDDIKREVHKQSPRIKTVPLPSYVKKGTKHGFSSAEGSYANSLVTNNAVYVPFYGKESRNQRAFDAFSSNTSKQVVPVRITGKVPVLGGSVRCMTWQIDQAHPIAKRLFDYVREKGATAAGASSTDGGAGPSGGY